MDYLLHQLNNSSRGGGTVLWLTSDTDFATGAVSVTVNANGTVFTCITTWMSNVIQVQVVLQSGDHTYARVTS